MEMSLPGRLLLALQGERVLAEVTGAGQCIWVTRTFAGSRVNLRTGLWDIQTVMDIRDPARPVGFPYRIAGIGLRLVPNVRRFLLIGIGGGAVIHLVYKHWPGAHVTAVDVNPAMPALAGKFFGMPTVETVIEDAADFVQKEQPPFDCIFVDAFDGMRTPPRLRTPEFWMHVARLLSPEGIVCVNSIRRYSFDQENAGLLKAFRQAFPYSAVVFGHPSVLPLPVNVVALGTAAPDIAGQNPVTSLREIRPVSWRTRALAKKIKWRYQQDCQERR